MSSAELNHVTKEQNFFEVVRFIQMRYPTSSLAFKVNEASKAIRLMKVDFRRGIKAKHCDNCGHYTRYNRELCDDCLSQFKTPETA